SGACAMSNSTGPRQQVAKSTDACIVAYSRRIMSIESPSSGYQVAIINPQMTPVQVPFKALWSISESEQRIRLHVWYNSGLTAKPPSRSRPIYDHRSAL